VKDLLPPPAVAVAPDYRPAILPGARDLTSPELAGGGSFLARHAGVRSRADSPSVAELVEAGWTVAFWNRWGGALLVRELDA
jgi:hypothetical protein